MSQLCINDIIKIQSSTLLKKCMHQTSSLNVIYVLLTQSTNKSLNIAANKHYKNYINLFSSKLRDIAQNKTKSYNV
jgi:hypothetical protein